MTAPSKEATKLKELTYQLKVEQAMTRDPVTVSPGTSMVRLRELLRDHKISGAPVVSKGKLVGIVTNRDLRFESGFDAPVSEVMTPKDRLVTVKEGAEKDEVIHLLQAHRIEKVLVVDNHFALRGLISCIGTASTRPSPGLTASTTWPPLSA